MEATQTVDRPGFESVWAILQRTAKRQAEADKRHEELEELVKEDEAKAAKRQAEANLREKFEELGLNFPRANPNVSINDKINQIYLEIDIMLENGDKAMLVETKTKLTIERINAHIERLEKMRKYADLRGDKRAFLGVVAGIVITEEAKTYALSQGLYLIEPSGDNFNITPPTGKPKEW